MHSSRLKFIAEQAAKFAEAVQPESFVMVVLDEDGTTAAVRWPPCDETCPHPNACTVAIYEAASDYLQGMAEHLDQKKPEYLS